MKSIFQKSLCSVLITYSLFVSFDRCYSFVSPLDPNNNLAHLITMNNITDGTNHDLAQLIVLDGLFGSGSNRWPYHKKVNWRDPNQRLAALIVADRATRGNNQDLADLIVLSNIFGNGINWNDPAESLVALIAVNNITGGTDQDLAQLIIANGLFE